MRAEMQCVDCRDLLDALLDDELIPEEAAAVRDHLAQCAECARAFESLATTSRLLKEGLVHYAAPDVLKARIRSALSQPDAYESSAPRRASPQHRWIRLAVAGVAIAIASSAATFAAMRQGGGPLARSVANEVLSSHVRSLMLPPGHLVDVASSNQHNVKPWFNGRVDLSPPVPSLDSAGFTLVGGRVDYLAGHPVAALVYSRRQHVINVYSWPAAGNDTQESVKTVQGYHLLNWRSNGIEFWAASDLNSAELSDFVRRYRRNASDAAR